MAAPNVPSSPAAKERHLRRMNRIESRRTAPRPDRNKGYYGDEGSETANGGTGGYTNTDLDRPVEIDDEQEPDEQMDAPKQETRSQPKQGRLTRQKPEEQKLPGENLPEGSRPVPEAEQQQEGSSAEQYARSNREETATQKKEGAEQTIRQQVAQQQQGAGAVKGEARLPTSRLQAMFRANVARDRAMQATGRAVATAGRVAGQVLLAAARSILVALAPCLVPILIVLTIIGFVIMLVVFIATGDAPDTGSNGNTNPNAELFRYVD